MSAPRVSLVTGAAGFVGRNLVQALKARGDDVRAIDIADSTEIGGVDYRKVDITDANAVLEACAGVDSVFHAASLVHTKWNQIEAVWGVNLGGTENIIAGCRAGGVKRLNYVSSASVVYEGRDIENGDEALPYATSSQAPYADSKIKAEQLVLQNNDDTLATCAIRPHVIFGPGDPRFVPTLVKAARSGRLRVQVGLSNWMSDYTFVDNVSDALILADDKLAPGSAVAGEAFFITNGEPMEFWGFVRKVLAELELPPIKFAVPHQLVYAVAAIKEGIDTLRGGTLNAEDGLSRFAVRYMCTHHYFAIEKARRLLGYEPRVSIDEGIKLTCDHLRASGALEAA